MTTSNVITGKVHYDPEQVRNVSGEAFDELFIKTEPLVEGTNKQIPIEVAPNLKILTFREFLPIVETAEPKLSWFGSRFICLNNLNVNLGIDSLAKCMLELFRQNPNFSEADRSLVQRISNLIDKIYDKSDKQVKECWFFIRFIVWIRDLRNSMFPHFSWSHTRFLWRECEAINFSGYRKIQSLYTKEQFQNTFDYIPTKYERDESFFGIPRWRCSKPKEKRQIQVVHLLPSSKIGQ